MPERERQKEKERTIAICEALCGQMTRMRERSVVYQSKAGDECMRALGAHKKQREVELS